MPSFVTVVMPCTTCADQRPFVQPDCADGHGTDCPDWMCLECGAAVVSGRIGSDGGVPGSASHGVAA